MIDHRRLGRELDLFVSDPLAGAGLPIWLPAGAAARHAVEEYVRELERRAGYQHVYSPPLGKRELFELSGHLGYFADDMFPPMRLSADDEFVLRPALCPHHALVYRARGRSYRELPLRVGELGGMYRAERSGVLGGLSRVRAISLNDAHNFCTLEQVGDEVREILRLIREAHAALGVRPAGFRLSLRGPGAKYVGDDAAWARAEELLRAALDGVDVTSRRPARPPSTVRRSTSRSSTRPVGSRPSPPCSSTSTSRRSSTCPTPTRPARRRRPVLVHRSLVGSMERLFALPDRGARRRVPALVRPGPAACCCRSTPGRPTRRPGWPAGRSTAGLRAEVDAAGSLGARIRDASRRRVPYVGVVGAREAAAGAVSLRLRDGRALDPMPAADAVGLVGAVVAARSADLLPAG